MRTSEQINELAAHLVAAQVEMPNMAKDATANVGKFSYSYVTLDQIMNKIRPVLASNGLVIVQSPTSDGDRIGLVTRLIHVSGQWLEETIYAPPDNSQTRSAIQAAGSTITYLRRYAIASLLGLVDETDTDGTTNGHGEPPRKAPAPTSPPMPTDAMRKRFHALGVEKYGDGWDDKRPQLVAAITKKRQDGSGPITSSNDLYRAEMQFLIDGMATG